MPSARELYTVGPSTQTIEAFLALLTEAGVEAIADARRWAFHHVGSARGVFGYPNAPSIRQP